MSALLRCALVCCVPLLAAAEPPPGRAPLPVADPKDPKVLASQAGLIDVDHGLLYFAEGANAAATVVALRLVDGKIVWRSPGASAPLYAVDDLVVAWADDDKQKAVAVLDAKSGKRLRRIVLGEKSPTPAGVMAPCSPPPPLTTLYGGRGRQLERVTSYYSCPETGWGGAMRSPEEIAAWQAKCTSWIRGTRWDLDTGEELPWQRPLDINHQAIAPLPSLDARGLIVSGVELVPGAESLSGRASNGKTLWSVPYLSLPPTPSAHQPCPAKP